MILVKTKSQHLTAGMQVRTVLGDVVTLDHVDVFQRTYLERGVSFPPCVLVRWHNDSMNYTFEFDEEVERVVG